MGEQSPIFLPFKSTIMGKKKDKKKAKKKKNKKTQYELVKVEPIEVLSWWDRFTHWLHN